MGVDYHTQFDVAASGVGAMAMVRPEFVTSPPLNRHVAALRRAAPHHQKSVCMGACM
jgi:hypothetical protein